MRVALYERVSTEEQALYGLSIDAQKNALEKWAKDNQHIIVDHYTDAGISARKKASARPELQRLLDDVRAKKIDLIVFTKLDRWFRNVKEYLKVDEVLEANKVAWKAIFEDYETETANGRFKLRIMLDLAELESDRTSERIKTVFAEKKRKGEVVTGSVPLGCKIVDRHLVPGEDADNVRLIFDNFLSLNSTAASQKYILEQTGRFITFAGLRLILKNRKYVDVGIISPETFAAAQERLKSRAPRTVNTIDYLFSGLIYCRECGSRFSSRSGKNHRYYVCQHRQKNTPCTNNNHIREEDIESYILKNLEEACKNLNAEIRSRRKKTVDKAAIKSKMNKLTDIYMNDLIQLEKYKAEYKRLEAQLEESTLQTKEVDEKKIADMLAMYGELPRNGKKEFWNRVIRRIEIDKDRAVYFWLNEHF